MSRPNIPVIDCRKILQFASILIWLRLFNSLQLYFKVILPLILRVWFPNGGLLVKETVTLCGGGDLVWR